MDLDYSSLEALRRHHPAWRLLMADHAPLVLSFLHRVFLASHQRILAQHDLLEGLEDTLFGLRETLGEDAFPRTAQEYLDDWAQDGRGWLRKYYPQGSDEPHFDLTPATEKALGWVEGLVSRAFVGTESRLRVVFDLLRQIVEGSEEDPETRIADLVRQRAELDARISRIRAGERETMDDTAVRERFYHMANTARELLADFREVEHNFRSLDRQTREQIARFEGLKGDLIRDILGQRDVIVDSDQGRSFRAFWDFLMSSRRQDELSRLLDQVMALPAVQVLQPDRRLRRIHHDWLEAGEHTQRTVALLSSQLRRFLEDQVWLENRRIMEVLRGLEARAMEVRDCMPPGDFMDLEPFAADISLPMERPLHVPTKTTLLREVQWDEALDEIDATALFDQWRLDIDALRDHIRRSLSDHPQLSLAELVKLRPVSEGLAEVLAYLVLATEGNAAVVDEEHQEEIRWTDEAGHDRGVRMPRVLFLREGASA